MKVPEHKNFPLLKWITGYSKAIAFLFVILVIGLITSYSADIGGVENNVVYSICNVLEGGKLYSNPEAENFAITQYTPLSYYLPILLCKLMGLKPLYHLHEIYLTGRIVSLLFNILTVIFIYKLLFSVLKTRYEIAFIASIIYFISLTKVHFAVRPDALFSLFSVLYLYCFIAYFSLPKKNIFLYLGVLFATLSFFVKQSGLQFIIIIPFFILLNREYKLFLKVCIMQAFLFGFVYLTFYGVYGENFFVNTTRGLRNGFSLIRTYEVFSNLYFRSQLLFICGFFLSYLYFKKESSDRVRFLSFNIIGLFVFALVTSAKEGSWVNYYNEFIVAVIILAAQQMNKISLHNVGKNIAQTALLFIAVVIISLMGNALMQGFFHEYYYNIRASKKEYNEKQKVAQIMAKKLALGNYFLCFDPHINAMLARHIVIPNKEIVPRLSPFNYSKYKQAYNNGQIAYIVLSKKKPITDYMGYNFSSLKEIYQENGFVILENANRISGTQ